MKKIGLLGYGTIGKYIFKQLQHNSNVDVTFVYDPFINTPDELTGVHLTVMDEAFLESVDLVVEVATSQVVEEYYELILSHTNLLIFSVTALSHEYIENNIKESAKKHHTNYYIPHGAILGLDGIFDGKPILNSVEIVTTKKPKGFSVDCNKKTILYEGPTRGACKAYPRNVNVHAAIALAGLGMDKTYSKIIADPDVSGNTHIITIIGDGIHFTITVESTPLGQVTGNYTPKSALGSLLRIIEDDNGIKFV